MIRHNISAMLDELKVAAYFACISPENTSKYEQQMLEIKDKIMDAFDAKDTEIRMLLGALENA